MSICSFGYFSFTFIGREFGSDCTRSWSFLFLLLKLCVGTRSNIIIIIILINFIIIMIIINIIIIITIIIIIIRGFR